MGVLPSKAGYQDTVTLREVTSVTKTALGGSGGSETLTLHWESLVTGASEVPPGQLR